MNYYENCITLRGRIHRSQYTYCQDSSGFYHGDHYSIVTVADGHGGLPNIRSHEGSRFAVNVAIQETKKFLENVGTSNIPSEMEVKELVSAIANSWKNEIKRFHQENQLNPKEKEKIGSKMVPESDCVKYYGTTLIIGVLTDSYSIGIQFGDGCLVTLNKDYTINTGYLELDPLCMNDYTTSLSDSDPSSIAHFRISKAGEELAFMACTDGFTKSFCPSDQEIDSSPEFKKYSAGLISMMADDNFWYDYACEQIEKCAMTLRKDDTSIAITTSNLIDFKRLYKMSFNRELGHTPLRKTREIVSKICFDGQTKNKTFRESWDWLTIYGNRYSSVYVDNGATSVFCKSIFTDHMLDITTQCLDKPGVEINGEAITKIYDGTNQGFEYKGYYKNGKMNGKGRLSHSGDTYIGSFLDGNADGYGELSTDYTIFKGQFKNGIINGNGVIINDYAGIIEEGEFQVKREKTASLLLKNKVVIFSDNYHGHEDNLSLSFMIIKNYLNSTKPLFSIFNDYKISKNIGPVMILENNQNNWVNLIETYTGSPRRIKVQKFKRTEYIEMFEDYTDNYEEGYEQDEELDQFQKRTSLILLDTTEECPNSRYRGRFDRLCHYAHDKCKKYLMKNGTFIAKVSMDLEWYEPNEQFKKFKKKQIEQVGSETYLICTGFNIDCQDEKSKKEPKKRRGN